MPPPCRFQDSWLNATVHPEYVGWLRKVPADNNVAFCSLCGKTLKLSSMGQRSLTIHMEGVGHKKAVTLLSRTPSISSLFTPAAGTSRQTDNQSVIDENPTSSTESSIASGSGVRVHAPVGMDDFTISHETVKAEVIWCLKRATAHLSYRSTDGIGEVFRKMFPDSKIAQSFSLGRDKAAYVTVYGLAPVFCKQLWRQLDRCSSIVVCFDEALNKVSQRCQMDMIARFWDTSTDRVTNRYLTSVFMGRSRAVDLAAGFKSGIGSIPLSKIQQVSMDGPTVNWRVYKDLKEEISIDEGKPTFLDAGSCGLHVVSGAFQCGHLATGWAVNSFLRSLWSLFKDCPARRAGYTFMTGSDVFPLKFCQVRWTQNSGTAKRALQMLPFVVTWVKEIKPVPQTATFRKVRDAVNDKLLPSKLHFFQSVAELLEPFLTQFQTPKPMFPFLYLSLEEMLRTLMSRVVKEDVMASATSATKMSRVQLSSSSNNLRAKPEVGFGAAQCLGQSRATELDKLGFYKNCRDFYVCVIEKLLEKSPLVHKVVRCASCLSTKLLKDQPTLCQTRMQGLLEVLVAANRLTTTDAEKAKTQFHNFCNSDRIMALVKAYKSKDGRLDDLYAGIFGQLEDYDELWGVCKIVLMMSHGNASVESGFSINNDMLITNLGENSLVAQRIVYDHVQSVGGILGVDINPDLLRSVRLSRGKYRSALDAKRSEDDKRAAQYKTERKRVVDTISELEEKRRAVVGAVKEQTKTIDVQLAELRKKMH